MASETTILNLTEKQLSELQSNGYVMVSRPNGSFKVKLSDFQAASGAATQSYVTSAIQSEAQRANAYTDSAVGALDIPTKTSELTNDAGFVKEVDNKFVKLVNGVDYQMEDLSATYGNDCTIYFNEITKEIMCRISFCRSTPFNTASTRHIKLFTFLKDEYYNKLFTYNVQANYFVRSSSGIGKDVGEIEIDPSDGAVYLNVFFNFESECYGIRTNLSYAVVN